MWKLPCGLGPHTNKQATLLTLQHCTLQLGSYTTSARQTTFTEEEDALTTAVIDIITFDVVCINTVDLSECFRLLHIKLFPKTVRFHTCTLESL